MENSNITEDILLKNGFKNDGTDVFSYIGNNCSIDMHYSLLSISDYIGRHWRCTIYTKDCKYVLGYATLQTVDQFNGFMKIMDVDCGPLKC